MFALLPNADLKSTVEGYDWSDLYECLETCEKPTGELGSLHPNLKITLDEGRLPSQRYARRYGFHLVLSNHEAEKSPIGRANEPSFKAQGGVAARTSRKKLAHNRRT